jgi:predicted outer membrane repeat protein
LDGYLGGGIFNAGTLKLTESTVRDNIAVVNGGGIYNLNGATEVFDAASRVTRNTAGNNGGGIYANSGTVTLVSSANVSGNTPNTCAGMLTIPLCSG